MGYSDQQPKEKLVALFLDREYKSTKKKPTQLKSQRGTGSLLYASNSSQ